MSKREWDSDKSCYRTLYTITYDDSSLFFRFKRRLTALWLVAIGYPFVVYTNTHHKQWKGDGHWVCKSIEIIEKYERGQE